MSTDSLSTDSLEDIKSLLDSLDPAALLPDLTTLMGRVSLLTRIAVLVGPIVLLVMGLMYLLLSPKEANYHFGYRCYFGMGSVEAWRFTQRMAGIVWGVLGLGMTIVMLVLTMSFGSSGVDEVMDVITTGAVCLICEAVLTLLSCIVINVTVMVRFNRKGGRRGSRQ